MRRARPVSPPGGHEADGRDLPLFHPCPPDPACPHCGTAATPGADRPDWSFVDGAYCISLRSRPDRAASAAAEFHRVGLCWKVVFYRPAKHPTRPKIGIWEAHRRVALEGLPPDWTIFFLGHWPLRAWFVRRNVLRSSSGGAHAYVASPRLLAWLRDHPFGTAPFVRLAGTGIDAAYAALPGAYALFPMLATQSGIVSDHLADGTKRKLKKPEHLFSRWRHRERLLSGLARPNELAVAALSPLCYALDRLGLPLRVRPPRLPVTKDVPAGVAAAVQESG